MRAWSELPLLLCCLAQHDPQEQRHGAVRVLQECRKVADFATCHPLVRLICSPGTVERHQLELLAAGATLQSLPDLTLRVAPLAFPMVAERFIESLHAATRREIAKAPRHSLVHVALAHSQQEIQNKMSSDLIWLERYAEGCRTVRNPMLAVDVLGLREHPAVQKVLSGLVSGHSKHQRVQRTHRPLLVDVIYHADLDSMFVKLPPGLLQPPADTPHSVEKIHATSADSLVDAFWLHQALLHFRSFLDDADHKETCLFSLGPGLSDGPSGALPSSFLGRWTAPGCSPLHLPACCRTLMSPWPLRLMTRACSLGCLTLLPLPLGRQYALMGFFSSG